jgi:hypothetical protein
VGTNAQNLISAVSQSKGERLPEDAGLSCPSGVYLEFYRGTNLLAQVHGHDRHFVVGDVSYTDLSGVLQEAWNAVYEATDKR